MTDLTTNDQECILKRELYQRETRDVTVQRTVKINAMLHDTVIAPIWDLVAGDGKGAEMFVQENIAAFGEDGNIKDYSRLKLTIGDLYMPSYILLEEDPCGAGGVLFFTDADEEDEALRKKEPERKLDRLCYVIIQDGEIYARLYDDTSRDDLAHYLIHSIDVPKNMHVFVFFCDKEMKHFSPSEYQMLFVEE
ncbi:hypothetical protein EYV94_10625 [Puteibacter caeruleilacunae]|nr:hypothetical protein EYV94_10625 [Puteibacter caeruleilacunae]